MLADLYKTTPQSGQLSPDTHLRDTSRMELIAFIADHLPSWRDDAVRPAETGEDVLTSQLCAYLNSEARHSDLDHIQFQPQFPDETHKNRRPDLVALPREFQVLVEGICHTRYEPILPIECKRLPTPTGKDRDEREYVINKHNSTGGIQRFKAGHHGATHDLAVMIAYVQENSLAHWEKCVAKWIEDLVKEERAGWTTNDLLHRQKRYKAKGIAVLVSTHTREKSLPELNLRHLWIKMS